MAITGNSSLLEQHVRIRMKHDIISTVTAVQGDTGREFYFVFDDFDVPEDAEIRVYVKKPSGKEIYHYGYLANGEVVIQPTMQMLAEIGRNLGQIQIIKNHVILTSYIFYLDVEENIIYSISFTSMDEYLILSDLIDTSRIDIEQIETLNQIVSEQEAERVNAEQERISAEETRKANENSRIATEENRVTAENSRVNAEKVRVNSENERINSETDRNEAETIRISNENERIAAENQRASAEIIRVNAENARVTSESERIAAENIRIQNEIDRQTSESDRVNSENTRISNETNRVSAEQTRVTAENDRQTNTANAIADCNTATERANAVTETLEDAIAGVVNDSISSTTTTYSSEKIEDLISLIIQSGTTEPTNQPINGLWFIEEE